MLALSHEVGGEVTTADIQQGCGIGPCTGQPLYLNSEEEPNGPKSLWSHCRSLASFPTGNVEGQGELIYLHLVYVYK
jgi:hypothetical protein